MTKTMIRPRTLAWMPLLMLAIFSFRTPSVAAIKRTSGNGLLATASPLVYERSVNPRIGITPDKQAKGSSYSVVNEKGRTVMTGTIRSSETFYLPTGKLGPGLFSFYINGVLVQQFAVS